MKSFNEFVSIKESIHTHDYYANKTNDNNDAQFKLNKSAMSKASDYSDAQFKLNKSVINKLISGEDIVTKNPQDVAGLYIKSQIDNQGNRIGVSDLPELKGMKFQISYSNGTYFLKRI